MRTIENITATREYALAKQVENGINDYCFDPKVFAAAIPTFHRTLQQSFWRTIKECVKVYAADGYATDPRNQASHEEAKAIMEYLKATPRHIPFI